MGARSRSEGSGKACIRLGGEGQAEDDLSPNQVGHLTAGLAPDRQASTEGTAGEGSRKGSTGQIAGRELKDLNLAQEKDPSRMSSCPNQLTPNPGRSQDARLHLGQLRDEC
jgi:hypothetical protein